MTLLNDEEEVLAAIQEDYQIFISDDSLPWERGSEKGTHFDWSYEARQDRFELNLTTDLDVIPARTGFEHGIELGGRLKTHLGTSLTFKIDVILESVRRLGNYTPRDGKTEPFYECLYRTEITRVWGQSPLNALFRKIT